MTRSMHVHNSAYLVEYVYWFNAAQMTLYEFDSHV
jgi:hypothetical protein